MTGRLRCCVPFCKGTRGIRKGESELPEEWICSKHWPLVPKRLRRLHGMCKRALKQGRDVWDVAERTWERCKRAAIEAAGGIG